MQLSVLASWLPQHNNISYYNNHHFKHSNKETIQEPQVKSHLGDATWSFKIFLQKIRRFLFIFYSEGTLLALIIPV